MLMSCSVDMGYVDRPLGVIPPKGFVNKRPLKVFNSPLVWWPFGSINNALFGTLLRTQLVSLLFGAIP